MFCHFRYGAGLWNIAISTIFWKPIVNSSPNALLLEGKDSINSNAIAFKHTLLRIGVGVFGIGYGLVSHIKQFPWTYYIIPVGGLLKIHLFLDHMQTNFRIDSTDNHSKLIKQSSNTSLLTQVLYGDLLWAIGFFYYLFQFHYVGIQNVAK